jgi:hypothetical protein
MCGQTRSLLTTTEGFQRPFEVTRGEDFQSIRQNFVLNPDPIRL